MERIGNYQPLLQCCALEIVYDFERKAGHVAVPEGQCTDMSGAILFFTNIDPAVKAIFVEDTQGEGNHYARLDNKWIAGRLTGGRVRIFDEHVPQDRGAERSVLGAILIDNDAFTIAAQIITADDFYHDSNGRIFQQMIMLDEQHIEIDFVTLKAALTMAGDLDNVGGPAYIASLTDGIPKATHVEYYVRIVKEKATLRKLITAATGVISSAYEEANRYDERDDSDPED